MTRMIRAESRMTEAQRRAYLDTMGINVWVGKPATPEADRLVVGPGSGSTLLLCRAAEESATRLAADIGRCLVDPVWSWPDPEGNPDSPSLQETIEQHLFTQVLLFGPALAKRAIKGPLPDILASASLKVIADLEELAVSGQARRDLWQYLSITTDDC
jgi:hypothetical protein